MKTQKPAELVKEIKRAINKKIISIEKKVYKCKVIAISLKSGVRRIKRKREKFHLPNLIHFFNSQHQQFYTIDSDLMCGMCKKRSLPIFCYFFFFLRLLTKLNIFGGL